MSARPIMRGMLAGQMKQHIMIGAVLTAVIGTSYRYVVQMPHRNRVETFYKSADHEKEYERQKAAGVFNSIRPDGSVGEGW